MISADDMVHESPPKSIGIVSRYDNENAINIAQKIYHHLSKIPGISVKVEPHTAKQFIGNEIECEFAHIKDMNVDAIIAIGGDGTILRTIQAMDCLLYT